MNWIKTQSELFFLALSFFSRLPIPASTPYSEERMNRAGRYFALVGALLGFLCALSYLLLTTLFPADIAIFLTMALSLLLTGAFHEDGLTDMADGVGGGMTTERRLAIMKDSRIGTYGASALIMALLGKYLLLPELAVRTELFWIWVAAYTLSRTVAASLIFNTPYVSDSDQSKSKPLAQKQSPNELLFLICCGLLSIWWLTPLAAAIVVSVALAFRFTFKRWLVSRLGGFTGDCLGAGQQIMELLFYCVILALLNTGNF